VYADGISLTEVTPPMAGREFVGALIEAGLVDTELLIERIDQLPDTVAPQVQLRSAGHRPEPSPRRLVCVDGVARRP
jgi:hypothetical protein